MIIPANAADGGGVLFYGKSGELQNGNAGPKT